MPSDDWKRMQELFEQAVDLDGIERERLLKSACAGNDQLRVEVQSLLLHHDESRQALDSPAVRLASRHDPATSAPDLTGTRVGRYRVQSLLGTGGMSTVYLAEQEQPRRQVALKFIRAGVASRAAIRRFEYESQVLGRLRHPNIAQVYEAGTQDTADGGMPFFAMEFVPCARELTQFAEEEGLSLRERLELFVRVCDAVQHGHRRGIIHRDLKPSNILVDDAGEPKIIDFGVARATDSDLAKTTLITSVGQLVGTLQYMSPEQCAADPADLDTRSDVYSLGVVLYELLCGTPPYSIPRSAVHEAIRVIRETSPAKPSLHNRVLRGDVETIVLKGLEKARERRYQSAADLGHDIKRFLRSEPIEARPPTVTYQLRMLLRRNRRLAMAVAAMFVILLATAITVTFLLTRLQASSQRARIVGNTIRAIESRMCDTGYNLESSRAMVFFLPRSEQPSHGGRILILYPQSQGTPLASLFFLKEDGSLAREFSTEFALPEHVGFRRYDKPKGIWLRGAVVGDMLPANPGLEVAIAMIDQDHAPSVIQIWDFELEGEPLAELWNVGHFQTMHWDQEHGMLVAVATSNELAATVPELDRWHELAVLRSGFPKMVLGWRPRLGSHVLFPLAASAEIPEADLDLAIVRLPDYDAELASKRSVYIDSCLPPTSGSREAICQLSLQQTIRSASAGQFRYRNFTTDISTAGSVLGTFVDEEGYTFADATGLEKPVLFSLDLPLLREAGRIVTDLADRVLTPEVARRRLEQREGLPTAVLETAATIVHLRFPGEAVWTAREIVDVPGRTKQEYEIALALATQAREWRPHDEAALTALGLARYRLADSATELEAALDVLRDADREAHKRPARVAAIALALHRLGRHGEARRELIRMEWEIFKDGPFAQRGPKLVEEAKRLVGDPTGQPPSQTGE
jgi:serine/threonine protein kinase